MTVSVPTSEEFALALAALDARFDAGDAERDELADEVARLVARVAALEGADPDPDPDPAPTPTRVVRVNVGGPALAVAGVAWEADRGFTGGQTSAQGSGHYGGPSVYDTERWGSRFSYALTGLPVGTAVVRLHFAENYEPTDRPGERVFDVTAVGVTRSGVDVVAEAGGQHVPYVLDVPVDVPPSGRVDVSLVGRVNAATLHALEALCYGTVQPDPEPDPDPDPVPDPTPGAWLSGGNPNNNTQTGAEQFGAWRGKKCGIALAYPPRDNGWGPLVSATSLPQGVWTDKTVVLIVQMPFFPKGSDSYAEAGRYGTDMTKTGSCDARWREFGNNWAKREAAGFAQAVISPGWEPNHDALHYWSGPSGNGQNYRNYAEYVNTFRRFVTVVRTVYPGARFAWTMNGHDSPGFGAGAFPANDPRNIYPGKEYLDFVGVDYYDHFPPSFGGTSASAGRKDFHVEAREVNGIRWYIEFAIAEGLEFLCPEWACNSGNVAGGNHGGDNPSFVANMHGEFTYAKSKGVMGGECYYEDTAQRMGVMNGQNPKAAQKYLELFGG